MAHVKLDLDDLTNNALKRLVKQLLAADDGDEERVLNQLSGKKAAPKNDLADLHEEMHGPANAPEVEPDDGPGGDEMKKAIKKKETKRG